MKDNFENAAQNFLGEENFKPTDGNIALSIKAYLKFCDKNDNVFIPS